MTTSIASPSGTLETTSSAVTSDGAITSPADAMEAFAARSARLVDLMTGRGLFFIVGCEKSGTSWLQHLLNGHPQITCRGESRIGVLLFPLLRQVVDTWNANHLLGPKGGLDDAAWRHLAVTAAALVFENAWPLQPRTVLIGEKTPGHAKAIHELGGLFPHAKFIHIVRDGRDGAVSGWHHNLHRGRPDFRQRFPRFADYVRYFVQAHWLPYINTARSFGASHPERYHELRYEDLHDHGPETVGRLLAFLDVEHDEPSVMHAIERGAFERLSKGRGRGVEQADSHFRKGIVGDWQNMFDNAALSAFMSDGGREMLLNLGYTIDPATRATA